VEVLVLGKVSEGDFIVASGKNDGTAVVKSIGALGGGIVGRFVVSAQFDLSCRSLQSSSDESLKVIGCQVGIDNKTEFYAMLLERSRSFCFKCNSESKSDRDTNWCCSANEAPEEGVFFETSG
jgi:hypothetical protein